MFAIAAVLHLVLVGVDGGSVVKPPGLVKADVPLFEFHSGFWLNLHQTLYELGQKEASAQGVSLWRPRVEFSVPPAASELTQEDSIAWNAAVSYYAKTLAEKDLLFDDGLRDIKGILSKLEDADVLQHPKLTSGLVELLNRVAPIYRKKGWPEQDRANREWLEKQTPNIKQVGVKLAQALETTFDTKLPSKRIRVDLVSAAAGGGAYTSVSLTHIVFATLDPKHKGLVGLEQLFHETSHLLTDKLEASLEKAAKREHIEIGDLWHAVQFFTVGEIVRRRFHGYQPFAVEKGMLTDGKWAPFRKPMEEVWIRKIESKIPINEVANALVHRIAEDRAKLDGGAK